LKLAKNHGLKVQGLGGSEVLGSGPVKYVPLSLSWI